MVIQEAVFTWRGVDITIRYAFNLAKNREKQHHIDIMTARFVLQSEQFDLVGASNLFGDILSDLGPVCTGTIGISPSVNFSPIVIFLRYLNKFIVPLLTSMAKVLQTLLV